MRIENYKANSDFKTLSDTPDTNYSYLNDKTGFGFIYMFKTRPGINFLLFRISFANMNFSEMCFANEDR